jgi:hypothetical protein
MNEAECRAEPTKDAQFVPTGDKKTEAPHPVQEPEPALLKDNTVAECVAIKKDQQDAIGQGKDVLTKLGLANIYAKQLGING